MRVLVVEVRIFPVAEATQVVAVRVGYRAVGETRCLDDGDAVAGDAVELPPLRGGGGGVLIVCFP